MADHVNEVHLAAATAYPDDEAQGELVVLRRSELFEFLGANCLPPWQDSEGHWIGGDVDCAPIAQRLTTWVEEHRL